MAYSDQDFEDELRTKLGANAPLPPGMDWEAMRKGVKQKVEAKRKKKRRVLAWWWPGLGIALLFLSGLIGYQLKQIGSSQLQQPPAAAAETSPGEVVKVQVDHPPVFVDIAPKKDRSDAVNPLSENGITAQGKVPPITTRPNGEYSAYVFNEPQTRSLSASKNSFSPTPGLPISVEGSSIPSIMPFPEEQTVSSPEAKALPISPLQSPLFLVEGNFLALPQVSIETEDDEGAPRTKSWFFDAIIGTQLAGATYRGDNAEYAALRTETETPLPGHHLALGLGKTFKKKWQLRTGIAYDRIRTRTDFNTSITFDSSFQNVPLRVDLSGDTIFGPATLEVRESREVRSFQREQRLTIPLMIGRNFRLGKTRLALRAGPEFGLLIGSGGRIITADEEVRPLSGSDFQRLNVSARVEGELVVPLGARGPLLIGRIGYRQMLNRSALEVRRTGSSLVGGVGVRMPF